MHKYEQKLMWTLMRNLLRYLPARHPKLDTLLREAGQLFVLGRHADTWCKRERTATGPRNGCRPR